MSNLEIGIPTSLGEIITIKQHLDAVKSKYDQINICYATGLWDSCLHTDAPDWGSKKILWNKFLTDISHLFFSNEPYTVNMGAGYPFYDSANLAIMLGIPPQKPELGHLLCDGYSLNIREEYIVITTKIRHFRKCTFDSISSQLWKVLEQLSTRYKIVVLGERAVEMRKEYQLPHLKDEIFGIYQNIMENIPNDRILDLTVPALGETVSDLRQIRQDCLIMREAKFVLTIGIGGNFCMSTAVANMTIGLREDNLEFGNAIYEGKDYSNAIITKDLSRFMKILQSYL